MASTHWRVTGSTPAPGFANAIMSTNNPTTILFRHLKSELAHYNARLDRRLRSRYGMTLAKYKLVKAVTQLVGAMAGIIAMTKGADPMTAFVLVAFIIGGPEAFEMVLESQPDQDDQ